MKVIVLAPNERKKDRDYGDCIIINDNNEVTIFDCGSDELADKVLEYLKVNNIDEVNIVLSHNDSDHFDGIPKLVESGVVKSITTLLLLKYKEKIFDKIDDGRVTIESLENHILDMYSNIAALSGNNLVNALDMDNISKNVKVVGPSEKYFIEAVSKQFTPTEGNTIDNSTIMNAISVQLEVSFPETKLLLTGDADLAAFDDKINNYDSIQLPHHGNPEMAQKIFDINSKRNNVLYIVSDNKGDNINGGSDKLNKKGHRILNTRNGTLEIEQSAFHPNKKGTLCQYEIYSVERKY